MSPDGSKEKRRFPRYDIAVPVILRRKAGDMNLHTVDISRHGAFVRVDPPLALRQLVQMRFRVPDLGDVDAMCMVARSLGKDHPRGPGIGVDFFALSKDAKLIWERFVHVVRARAPSGDGTAAELPAVPGVPLPSAPPAIPVVQSHPLFPTSPPMSVLAPPISASAPVAVPRPRALPPPLPPPVVHDLVQKKAPPVVQQAPQIPARPVAEAPPPWFAPNSLTATQASMPFPAASPATARSPAMSPEIFQPMPSAPHPVASSAARGPVTGMMAAITVTQAAPAPQAIPPQALTPVSTGVYRVPTSLQQQLQMVEAAQPVPAPPPLAPLQVEEEDVVSLDADDGAVVMLRLADREGLRAFVERDVARGGMFLKTPLIKEVGEKISLIVVHPETDDEFHLDGTVVRRVITGPMEQRGLGIFFRSLNKEREAQLNEFVEGGVEVVELGTPISQHQLDLEAAVAREPDSPEALEALGVFLLDDEGDLGGALTALTRALVLGPSVVSIHASLARAYRKIGDSVKVRAHERVAESLMLMQERMKVRLGVGDD